MTTHVEVTRAGSLSSAGAVAIETTLLDSQTMTLDNTSQSTTFNFASVSPRNGLYVTIVPGEDCWLVIGKPALNALVAPRRRLLAGVPRSFEFNADWQVALSLQ